MYFNMYKRELILNEKIDQSMGTSYFNSLIKSKY